MFKFLTDLVIGWKVKLIAAGLFMVTIAGYLFKIKRESYNKGKEAVNEAIRKENERVRDGWQKIDDTPSTVDDALGRLRKRSSAKGDRP